MTLVRSAVYKLSYLLTYLLTYLEVARTTFLALRGGISGVAYFTYVFVLSADEACETYAVPTKTTER